MAGAKLKKPVWIIGATNFNSGDLLVAFSSVILEYQYYLSVLNHIECNAWQMKP